MEPQGALDIWRDIHNKFNGNVYWENFLSDDDSTTRATLSREDDNKHGCLPNDCHPPTFWADTNHRIKCMAKPPFDNYQISSRI